MEIFHKKCWLRAIASTKIEPKYIHHLQIAVTPIFGFAKGSQTLVKAQTPSLWETTPAVIFPIDCCLSVYIERKIPNK